MDTENNYTDFDDIRPLEGQEISPAIERLLQEARFKHAIQFAIPEISFEEFSKQLSSCKNIREFQHRMIKPFLFSLADKTTAGISLEFNENAKGNTPSAYISNHRDIILDAAFFNILLMDKDFETTEIAIGDNLLIFPWIKDLVRMNKSFIVQRGVSKRQVLEVSKKLSAYIHHVIQIKKGSIWIAQREGRAKDANDQTQDSLLKMLSLYDKNNFLESIRALNITPLSISYEYDPCDYLKAAEFQMKRDDPEYKKRDIDDLINMETGLFGYKGQVRFRVCNPINSQLHTISTDLDKAMQVSAAGKLIDREIHKNYRIFPINYVAYDMLEQASDFSNMYTSEEKAAVEAYLNERLEKINIPNKDDDFLMTKLLTMYSNPLKNKLIAENQ